jgi:hypothetical protein
MTIEEFAKRVQEGQEDSLRRANLACQANMENAITRIKPGRKWTKVDMGYSGKFMIDPEGNIYGIKGYGVPHYGHYFGTLDNPSPACFVGSWG